MIRRPPRSTLFPYTNALPISKQLLGFEFRFARACAPQQANMQHNDVFSAGLDAVQHSSQMIRSEEHTSELQSLAYLVCRLLLEKKKVRSSYITFSHLRKYRLS